MRERKNPENLTKRIFRYFVKFLASKTKTKKKILNSKWIGVIVIIKHERERERRKIIIIPKGVAERIGKAVSFGLVWGRLRIVSVSETINHRERLKES